MAYIRQTLVARNLEGLKAKARARTQRQKLRVLQATAENLEEEFGIWQALCPRDTQYMAEHMIHRLTRGGYNYFIGFLRGDFVGKVNPVTQRLITEFYPDFVVGGTRRMAGNDFPREARRIMKPRSAARYRRALAG